MPVTFPGLQLSNETRFFEAKELERSLKSRLHDSVWSMEAWGGAACSGGGQGIESKKKKKKGNCVYSSLPAANMLFVNMMRHNEREFVT